MEKPILDKEPGKILVVKPSALGDIVHSLPFLRSVKKRFPRCLIHWVVARGLHEILEGHPLLDRLWVINKNEWKKLSRAKETARELRGLFSGLRAEGFDIAVDLQGLLRSGLIAMASGAGIRVGFNEAREGSTVFYTHRVRGGEDVHAVLRYLKIASFLGCEEDDVRFPFPPLPEIQPLLGPLPREYAVVAPSAGKEANRWPARRFGELALRLPVSTVVVSGKEDARVAQEVVESSRGKAVSLAGRTNLKELSALIKRAAFLVSNDTGPMHIAAAFGVPVFAVFGPANPAKTGPFGEIHTVIRRELDCSPCYRKKKCKDWKCMEEVTVDMVYDAVMEKLKKGLLKDRVLI